MRLTPCQVFALILVRDKDTYFGALHNSQALNGRNRTLASLHRIGLIRNKIIAKGQANEGTVYVLTKKGQMELEARNLFPE